jgi:hypothetical protein
MPSGGGATQRTGRGQGAFDLRRTRKRPPMLAPRHEIRSHHRHMSPRFGRPARRSGGRPGGLHRLRSVYGTIAAAALRPGCAPDVRMCSAEHTALRSTTLVMPHKAPGHLRHAEWSCRRRRRHGMNNEAFHGSLSRRLAPPTHALGETAILPGVRMTIEDGRSAQPRRRNSFSLITLDEMPRQARPDDGATASARGLDLWRATSRPAR